MAMELVSWSPVRGGGGGGEGGERERDRESIFNNRHLPQIDP